MNLARAFSAMVALAIVACLFAIVALGQAIRSADADVVVRAHGSLATVALRIASVYSTQILPLQSDLSVAISAKTIDGYGRRVVAATIGDNEGVDGGLYLSASGLLADAPQRVGSRRERVAIADLARRTLAAKRPQFATIALPIGAVVAVDAAPLADGAGVAWARERISASALHGGQTQRLLIAAAAASTVGLALLGGWIVWTIRRDARRVLVAIAELEREPGAVVDIPSGDFGAIAAAVQTMAGHRAHAEAVALQSERTAQRSERLAAIGRLAANAAHEIRNPLNALRLQVALLRRRGGETFAASTAQIGGEIERLDAVVGGMLAAGTDGAIPERPVDLHVVCRRAITVLELDARARGRTIELISGTPETLVTGDEGRLMQLAINMLANAIDASPAGGNVTMTIDAGPVLRIRDGGGGIEAGALAHIFEPFFTTKPSGTGLGLAIAHEIARAHGARIDVATVPGSTEFRVDFRGQQHD